MQNTQKWSCTSCWKILVMWACKSSWNPTGILKSFPLTIPWSSAKLVKISPGIIVRQHHTGNESDYWERAVRRVKEGTSGGTGKTPGGLLKQFRKSRKRQAKSWDRTERPVVNGALPKPQTNGFQEFILLLQINRLQLTAVYCNRREV